MSKARLIITALFTEGRSPSEVALRYGVHRGWVYKLKARYEAEGETAVQPRSRRPKASPRATPQATVDLVLRLRKQLREAAWTPVRTPSAGICSTGTASGCRGPPFTGS